MTSMIEKGLLGLFYVYCTGTFLTLADFIFNGISFIKAIPLRFGVMDEEVLAIVILYDKAVPLFIIEPLNFSCSHFVLCVEVFICVKLYEALVIGLELDFAGRQDVRLS